jgi:hypothetical protein
MKNQNKSKHNGKDKKMLNGSSARATKPTSARELKSPNMGFHGSDDERNLNAEE